MMNLDTAIGGRALATGKSPGQAGAQALACPDGRKPAARNASSRSAFSMVELLVAMTLLTLIVLALMVVFDSTQRAFRASMTQTDVLEGSRAAMDLITSDLRNMTPSYGVSNAVPPPPARPLNLGAVNFFAFNNSYDYSPLAQPLPGTDLQRTNVLEYFFILGKENTKWTATGYVVDASSASPLYPLYRFYTETNISANPYVLYTNFLSAVNFGQWTNMSHVIDGVVHLTVRAYDPYGYWMTNFFRSSGAGTSSSVIETNENVWFAQFPLAGEVNFICYSNAVPASVEVELGVLEDRTLQRAESLGVTSNAPVFVQPQWSYLENQAGHVHVFRQRVSIPNVDTSAYQ